MHILDFLNNFIDYKVSFTQYLASKLAFTAYNYSCFCIRLEKKNIIYILKTK